LPIEVVLPEPFQFLFQWEEKLCYRILQRALERLAILELLLAQHRDEGLRRGDAAVRLQQRAFQLVEQRLVDLAAREEIGKRSAENVPRARETCLEARRPGKRCYHG